MSTKATLTAVDSLPQIHREKSANVSGPIVDEFLASGARFSLVTRDADAKASGTRATLKRYVKVRNIMSVDVVIREGNVYLVRTDDVPSTNGDSAT